MLVLAIDQAAAESSVAVLEDTRVLAEERWTEARLRNQLLFAAIPNALEKASVRLSSIDLFAVDIGPGAFSSLRISLSAARGLALQRRRPVIGISSGEALACAISRETGHQRVTVVGDARRDRLWLAVFRVDNGCVSTEMKYTLFRAEELAEAIGSDSVVVTPDWHRIGDRLGELVPEGATVIDKACVPDAVDTGKLALGRAGGHRSMEPHEILSPIYLHPPVFVEPRFARFAP